MNIRISQIKVSRTLKHKDTDLSVSFTAEIGSDNGTLSIRESQLAYLQVALEVDMAALRAQLAKGIIDKETYLQQSQQLIQNYTQQMQEIAL